MKKITLIISLLLFYVISFSQQIPQIKLKDVNGKQVDSKKFIQNNGKPVLICFFSTTCKPCMKELDAYSELYEGWQKETGVKIVLIAVDNARTVNRVAGVVDSHEWDFEVYLDTNQDFKRAMNVVNEPHTFLVDGTGKIVWQHTSYNPGDEKTVFENIKKLTK